MQLLIGRGAVYLASMFIRRKAEKDGTFDSPKKPVFGVTFDDVSETYHLLHQINMACKWREGERAGAVVGGWVGGQEGQTTRNCLLSFLSAASHSSQLLGMGCFLGLNALNFAEADRPFNRLSDQQVAEMYFAMSLQCHYSMPYVSSLPMVSLQCHYSMPYVSSLAMVSLAHFRPGLDTRLIFESVFGH